MTPKELLIKGLKELGISPTEKQADSFMAYLRELKHWNRTYNLTSLKTDEDIVVKHFLDSCLYLTALKDHSGLKDHLEGGGRASIVDVGSGAGFPGVPIKILRPELPELKVYLIEPRKKKAAFLRHIIRTLGLKNIKVIEARVEDVKDIKVDAALTRALFSVEEFLKRASHVVREGGIFVLNKGPDVERELKDIKVKYELKVLRLPMSDIKRYMVLVRKSW